MTQKREFFNRLPDGTLVFGSNDNGKIMLGTALPNGPNGSAAEFLPSHPQYRPMRLFVNGMIELHEKRCRENL